MTTYTPPRSSQDLNQFMANPWLGISPYTENGNGSYNYSPHPQCEHGPQIYLTGAASFITTESTTTCSLPSDQQMAQQYPYASSALASTAIHHRPFTSTAPYVCQRVSQQSLPQSPHYSSAHEHFASPSVESQESINENTMLSEPVLPPLDGFPSIKEFDRLVNCYVDGLSSKKQDKALIHAKRARNIKAVLIDKKTTAVESAQFRFWVKKMFTLLPGDPKNSDQRKRQICHEGKPVAVREKLFKILTTAHKQCQHGGRDKTSAQVRRFYSWVPKELISRFVKLCPTCQARRGSMSSASSPSSPSKIVDDSIRRHSPNNPALTSGRESLLPRHMSSILPSSSVIANMYGSQYDGPQWIPPAPPTNSPVPIESQRSTTPMSGYSIRGMGQAEIPLTYVSSGIQDGNAGPPRSYTQVYESGHHYSHHSIY